MNESTKESAKPKASLIKGSFPWTKGIVRATGASVALVAGLLIYLLVLQDHYPIGEWMVWRNLCYFCLSLIWAVSSLGVGLRILHHFFPGRLWLSEQVAFGLGLGILCFGWCIFLIGLAGLLAWPVFYILPIAFAFIGARPLFALRANYKKMARICPSAFYLKPKDLAFLAVGGIGLAMMYTMVLLPGNVAYDARWYHLPLAEHYVAAGGVVRSGEGWFLAAYPQLMTYFYSWAFLIPGGELYDQVGLSAHIEFTIYLATLFSLLPLTRRLLKGRRVPHAWVAAFLFPGSFLYDSGLHVAADRLAAFWAPLIFLALLRAWPRLEARSIGLLAVILGACALTKYTAVSLLAFPVIAIAVRAPYLLVSHKRSLLNLGKALGWAVLLGLTISSAHWLKNWLWYGDPVYPLLHSHLNLRPWEADTLVPFENWFYSSKNRPPRTWEGVVETLKVLPTFSFIPNNWPDMHGALPVFGSLFSLSALCLPFVRRGRRLWAIFAAAHMAVFIWYWMHHFDRYLQIILPWMIAGTVAIFVRIRELGAVPKWALNALIVLQLAWGLDVPFYPGNPMLRTSIPEAFVRQTQSGFANQLAVTGKLPDLIKSRLEIYKPLSDIKKVLPPKSNVLLHEQHLQLGLGSRRVSDWLGSQGGINYKGLVSEAAIHKKLRGLGVTHLLSAESKTAGWQSIASDLVYYRFVQASGLDASKFGSLTLRRLNPQAPGAATSNQVFALGCKSGQPSGIFQLKEFNTSPPDPNPHHPIASAALPKPEALAAYKEAVFAISYKGCPTKGLMPAFKKLVDRPSETLWIRKKR